MGVVVEKLELEQIFTPSAPVESKFLMGRTQELNNLMGFSAERGALPTIIGNRGVGKTSLIHAFLANVGRSACVTCSMTSTFDDLARRILRKLGIDIYLNLRDDTGEHAPIRFTKLPQESGSKITHRLELSKRRITKDLFYDILSRFKSKFYIVFDEFDRLPKKKNGAHVDVTDLAKDLADNWRDHSAKVVVCGVASKSRDLFFTGHKSVGRQIREQFVHPLKRESIEEFLTKAGNAAGFFFRPEVLEAIVVESDGFPYAIHLVALESCRAARRASSATVFAKDLEQGREIAIRTAYNEYLERFKEKIETLNETEIQLLKHLNKLETSTISIQDLREDSQKSLDAKEFDAAWSGLVERCSILCEHPARSEDEFVFTDPLLRPFLRMQFNYPKGYRRRQRRRNEPDRRQSNLVFSSTDKPR